jgi:ferrous iron transport protein A
MGYQPLTFLNSGEQGTVKEICGGESAIKRLYGMGFNTGAQIEVVKNDVGPLIISLSGNKIAVGRGLAQKIMINN